MINLEGSGVLEKSVAGCERAGVCVGVGVSEGWSLTTLEGSGVLDASIGG